MAIDRTTGVSPEHFAGDGRVHGREVGSLGDLTRKGLTRETKERVRRRNLVDMTDSSGGVAGIVFTSTFASDLITLVPLQPDLKTGDGPFQLSGADLPSGLLTLTDYFVRSLDATGTTFNLHLTKGAALSNAAPVALADDGTPPHAVLAIARPVRAPEATIVSVTTGILDTSLDTSVDTFTAAYAVLMERLNEVRALTSAGSLDEGPGVIATSGTVAVLDVDVDVNGDDTDGVTFASWRTIEQELLDAEQTLIQAVNEARAAVGLGVVAISGPHIGNASVGLDLYDTVAATNASPTVDAAGAATSVLNVPVDALLAVLQDNVALLADLIDDVTDAPNAITTIVGPFDLGDVSSAGTFFATMPVSGRLIGLRTQTTVAMGAGDETLTVEIEGSAVLGLSLVIASAGSAPGIMDFDAPTLTPRLAPGAATGNYVARGQQLEVVNDGNTAAGEAICWFEIEETQEDTGTLVTGFGDDPIDNRAGI